MRFEVKIQSYLVSLTGLKECCVRELQTLDRSSSSMVKSSSCSQVLSSGQAPRSQYLDKFSANKLRLFYIIIGVVINVVPSGYTLKSL